MVRKKKLKDFLKAINKYSKGKSPKGLRVYVLDREGKKTEVIDLESEAL
ncbi:hypothetical protein LCGC14_0531490 [marine sediment metagenome]|uniref:Uncharacterized protein n=1 Tax=marine sediment metagenome TaxID=412755 RepID=A0A0F9V3M9_9ZZZZ